MSGLDDSKSSRPLVFLYGRDEPRKLASAKGVQLSSTLDKKHKLAQFSGAEFDRKYMGDMVSDHKEDVNKFQKETTEDPHVQKWASKTLPTLFEGEPPGGPKRRPTSPDIERHAKLSRARSRSR